MFYSITVLTVFVIKYSISKHLSETNCLDSNVYISQYSHGTYTEYFIIIC